MRPRPAPAQPPLTRNPAAAQCCSPPHTLSCRHLPWVMFFLPRGILAMAAGQAGSLPEARVTAVAAPPTVASRARDDAAAGPPLPAPAASRWGWVTPRPGGVRGSFEKGAPSEENSQK